jgi:hypothetical protein
MVCCEQAGAKLEVEERGDLEESSPDDKSIRLMIVVMMHQLIN